MENLEKEFEAKMQDINQNVMKKREEMRRIIMQAQG